MSVMLSFNIAIHAAEENCGRSFCSFSSLSKVEESLEERGLGGFGGDVTLTYLPFFAHIMLIKETVALMGENQQNPVASPDVHPPFSD